MAAVALSGLHLTAAGNGGFTVYYTDENFDPDVFIGILAIDCNSGFTCGTVNIEVDWDDGSEIDSIVKHWSAVADEEFDHEYDEDGTYHAETSADDNFGNWWKTTATFQISD